jgi:uncharacterized RDD family membrane protein YckC
MIFVSNSPAVGVSDHDDAADQLITGEAVALDLRAASFVLRAAGAVIDFVVYVVAYILMVLVLIDLAGRLGLDQAVTTAIGLSALVLCVVVIPVAVETITQGKSLGKLVVGARIVRDDGGAIGFRHAFIRALTGVFEIYMTFGGMAATVGLLNGKAKRLGDLVAGTYSQYERISRASTPVFTVPTELFTWSRTADVARMPDRLSRRVAQFLSQAGGFTQGSRRRLATELANEVSVYVSPVPTADPELFLAATAAMRREREAAALEIERSGLERLSPVLNGMPRGFPDRG